MKNEVSDSEYQFNSPFSVSKRIVGFLIDSLLLIVLMLVVFRATDALFVAGSARLRSLNARMEERRQKIVEQFTEAQLMIYNEERGEALEDPEQGEAFLYSLVCSTLGSDVLDASFYEGAHIYGDCGTTARSVLYFYGVFKPSHAAEFTDGGAAMGAEYGKELFLSGCNNAENGYFNEAAFPLLTWDVAVALDRLICINEKVSTVNGKVYHADEIYVQLYQTYYDILQEARTDLTNHYAPYAQLEEGFSAAREALIALKIGELCIAYAVSAAVYFLLVPLLAKGQTASVLFLRGRCIHAAGLRLKWYNYLLRWLAESILCFGNIIFVVLLTYGRYTSFFLMCDLFGGVKFYMIFLAAVACLAASLICLLCDRQKRRALTDLISRTVVKEKE